MVYVQREGDMAQGLSFNCRACGHCGDLAVGSSRSEYWTRLQWPLLCLECKSVRVANYRQDPLLCLSCHSRNVLEADSSEAWRGDGDDVYSASMFYPDTQLPRRWWQFGRRKVERRCRHMKLTDGHYLCPKCEDFELFFYVDTENFWIAD